MPLTGTIQVNWGMIGFVMRVQRVASLTTIIVDSRNSLSINQLRAYRIFVPDNISNGESPLRLPRVKVRWLKKNMIKLSVC